MFKHIKCEQNSDEWFDLRLGKYTASKFSDLITKTGKESITAEKTNFRLVAEKVLGFREDSFESKWMKRGSALEEEALDFVNFTFGKNFKKCGFIESEDGYGCSPDAMDFEDNIGLELKCPSPHVHLMYLSSETLPGEYKAQVQGSMLVTGFDSWFFCSYHPSFKGVFLKIDRDQEYIDKLEVILKKNIKIIDEIYKKII